VSPARLTRSTRVSDVLAKVSRRVADDDDDDVDDKAANVLMGARDRVIDITQEYDDDDDSADAYRVVGHDEDDEDDAAEEDLVEDDDEDDEDDGDDDDDEDGNADDSELAAERKTKRAARPKGKAVKGNKGVAKRRRTDGHDDDDDNDGAGAGAGAGAGGDAGGKTTFPSDFGALELKEDHGRRPLWVCPDGHVILERFSPVYQQAYDFLIAVAEPSSRPSHMHEYQLTPYSLLAAVSIGLKTEDIVSVLSRLSKNVLPPEVAKWIRDCTSTHGKVKVVLRHGRFFVESTQAAVLQRLLADDGIAQSRIVAEPAAADADAAAVAAGDSVDPVTGLLRATAPAENATFEIAGGLRAGGDVVDAALRNDSLAAPAPRSLLDVLDELDADAGGAELAAVAAAASGDGGAAAVAVAEPVHAFEVRRSEINHVRRQCVLLDLPALEEYDFRADHKTDTLKADLKPTSTLRPYQERSLSKMFGNGRARSGVIVLPCGAGKTLVGVTAACTIKKRVLVLCTSMVAVEQWKYQFQLWSDIDPRHISRFTREHKEALPACGVTVTTYSMVSHAGKRSKNAQSLMDKLAELEWGLLILDEVQVMPAKTFRTVLHRIAARCKLGLTATLVREDDKIQDLNFLVGPKLYEANWMDLQNAGHIAKVAAHEVWADMTPEFYAEYLRAKNQNLRRLLWVMNPNKFRACEYLVRHHEARGDKTIVFSDNIFALITYAKQLNRPFIFGDTSNRERLSVFTHFQHDPAMRTIFISKVGDNSIDLPAANVLIQISSHYASRRQEAQRLGRILRPKPRMDEEYNAFFYSIVSKDTAEMFYSAKRQEFLIEQGYSFRVLTGLARPGDPSLCLADWPAQRDLLAKVMATGDKSGALERSGADEAVPGAAALSKKTRRAVLLGIRAAPTRTVTAMAALAGGRARYVEKTPKHHSLFNKRKRDLEKDRARLGF